MQLGPTLQQRALLPLLLSPDVSLLVGAHQIASPPPPPPSNMLQTCAVCPDQLHAGDLLISSALPPLAPSC
jgi:hypothetical protein